MYAPRVSIVVGPMPVVISDDKRLGSGRIVVEMPEAWRLTPKAMAPDQPPTTESDPPPPPPPVAQPTPPREDGPKPQDPDWPEPVNRPDATYPERKKPKKN